MEEVNQPIVDSQKNNTPEATSTAQNKPSTFLVSLLSILLLISVFIAGFFAFQTQRLVKELQVMRNESKPTPIATQTPIATPDPTADWKEYVNERYSYKIKCPQTSTHKIELQNGDGIDKPLFQEICNENNNQVRILIYPISHSIVEPDGADVNEIYIEEINIPSNSNKVVLRGFDKKYFDQLLSTFKFIEPEASSSPLPVSCTMEAKICPDGTSVGRSGPKCEFAPCPSPKL